MTEVQTPYGQLVWEGEELPELREEVTLDSQLVVFGSLVTHTNGDILNYLPDPEDDNS